MNDRHRLAVIDAVTRIAPDVDPADIPPNADLQDELDLDSMDMLNVITVLSEHLGLDIPEDDYRELRTLASAVAYLDLRTARAAG
jgi:acyl carrier protein